MDWLLSIKKEKEEIKKKPSRLTRNIEEKIENE